MTPGEAIGEGAPPPWNDPFRGRLETMRADVRLAGRFITRPHPLILAVRDEGGNQVHLFPAAGWDGSRGALAPFASDYAAGRVALIVLGELPRRGIDEALSQGLVATLPLEASADQVFVALAGAFELLASRQRSEHRGESLDRYRAEIGKIVEIAQALTTERKIERLLALILEKCRYVTGADAGSIYVVEGDSPEITERMLRFSHTQNDSVSFDSREFRIPVSERSMSGYVALKRTLLNIADVYDLPADAPYGFDATFDRAIGYRTQSMLCAPLLSRAGEVLGVLQLINRKLVSSTKLAEFGAESTQVIAFDSRTEDLLTTLASFAGVALENAVLAGENERMLEGFVRASVAAIEQRDPTTSGHSIRVATMSVGLARALERCDSSEFRSIVWSSDDILELEYASLLHDFGKIGVREDVLLKAKKLYPQQLELIRSRFSLAERTLDVERLSRKLELIQANAAPEAVSLLEEQYAFRKSALVNSLEAVCRCNEPMLLHGGDFAAVEEVARGRYRDYRGEEQPLLTADELASLSVTRGSLTADELSEVRSHVLHTHGFLATIPWGRKLRNVPSIAVAHHERLNGTGYPYGLHGVAIPLQAKIMSVSDIFDALTASDRPYKRAVPLDRALDILAMEVRDGHIDGELVRIFKEARVWLTLEHPVF